MEPGSAIQHRGQLRAAVELSAVLNAAFMAPRVHRGLKQQLSLTGPRFAFPGHPLQPTLTHLKLVNSAWQSKSEPGPGRKEAYVQA